MKKINLGAVLFILIAVVAAIWITVDMVNYNKATKAANKIIEEWIDVMSDYINIPDYVMDGDEEAVEEYLNTFGKSIEKFYCSGSVVPLENVIQTEVSGLRSFIQRLRDNENILRPLGKCSVDIVKIGDAEINRGYYYVDYCLVNANVNNTNGLGSSSWMTVYRFTLKEVDGEWKMFGSFFNVFNGVMNQISAGNVYGDY